MRTGGATVFVLNTYEEEFLREIAFPLGGIGTGTVSLGGRGNLRDWEIMNRPSKGFAPEYAFFTLRTETDDGIKDTRIIEGMIPPPYTGASGVPGSTSGIPRFNKATFKAAYPFCTIDFSDPKVPLGIQLGAFNPLIPHDPERSGMPVAVFRFLLTNSTPKTVKASVAASLQNFIGNDGVDTVKVKPRNEYRKGNGFSGLLFGVDTEQNDASQIGTIALVTNGTSVSWNRHWARSSWRNDLLAFWDDFSADGALDDFEADGERTFTGSLASSVTIPSGKSTILLFLLAWHFPNRTAKDCGWNLQPDDKIGAIGNYYTTKYRDAWDVAEKTFPELSTLESETSAFVQAFGESTIPQAVKEAVLNNISTLRTQNCFRTTDGHFYGFEGTNDKSGCCFGSCTHVWNYETTTAFLFPSIARSMREVELAFSTNESGLNSFRTSLPLRKCCAECKPFGAAADGQMGVVMKLYREWKLSGDMELLKTLWPHAKRALSFCWVEGGWDSDRDGVMDGVQHNTYDVEFYGPNPMMTVWYLGALRSAEEMARAVGDAVFAKECRRLFEQGSRWVSANLFNGEYFIQKVQPPKDKTKIQKGLVVGMGAKDMDHPDFQVENGCLIDQLAGQYMAHVTGLGYLLDAKQVRKTMESIFKYNYRESFANHFNVLRSFVINDDAGLLICSWPHGDRPKVPFPYFSEVMTGFEYQAAALMIYEGMVDEGVRVVESIRARFDGRKRNPWDEPECGHHYARAMAAWSSLLALSGFHYDGIEKTIGFAPRYSPEKFRTFWAAGSGWGVYSQETGNGKITARLSLLRGTMELAGVSLGTGEKTISGASLTLAGKNVPVTVKSTPGTINLQMKKGIALSPGGVLEIKAG